MAPVASGTFEHGAIVRIPYIPFLEIAVDGKADFLATGDRDLLSLAGRLTCPIITADQFLMALGKEPPGP